MIKKYQYLDKVNFPSDIKVEFPSVKTKNYIYEETANFTCSLIFKMLFFYKSN